jgi:hypothetical protein
MSSRNGDRELRRCCNVARLRPPRLRNRRRGLLQSSPAYREPSTTPPRPVTRVGAMTTTSAKCAYCYGRTVTQVSRISVTNVSGLHPLPASNDRPRTIKVPCRQGAGDPSGSDLPCRQGAGDPGSLIFLAGKELATLRVRCSLPAKPEGRAGRNRGHAVCARYQAFRDQQFQTDSVTCRSDPLRLVA